MVFGGSFTLCRKLVCIVNCGISWSCSFTSLESKEEGNDQESIQSSTTLDPGHHMGKRQSTRKHHIQENQEVSPFQAGDHKAAMNRQDSMTNTKHK